MRPGAPPVEADGWAPGHHGELLQGSFTVADASPRPGLVTLPCPLVGSQATFTPGPHPLVVIPPSRRKARRAAQQCCDQLGVPARGTLVIRSAVPMARGFGSSTADVTAAIRAVATAHRRRLSAHDTARIAVAAEHAADPTMHGRPHLFDPETGRVIATAARRLPVLSVLGLDLAPEGPGVDTLATPRPPYSAAERDRFAELWDDLSQAVRRGDRTMMGKVATCSAEMHQRHRPTATFGDLIALAQHHRALGVQVAHSGTIAGVIFAPDQPHGLRRCRTALEDILGGPTWRFDTRAVQP